MIYVLGFIILGAVLFGVGRSIWWSFDHSGWYSNARPDRDATITSCNSEKVKYEKNGAKFKTTVEFSDGFYYITHKTNREQHVFTYNISIDSALKSEILTKAMDKHKTAVEKKLAKK